MTHEEFAERLVGLGGFENGGFLVSPVVGSTCQVFTSDKLLGSFTGFDPHSMARAWIARHV